jgi:fumarylacetoacetate (FAA) hydrolase
VASEDFGVDFEGEVAVVVGDVRAGCAREEAADAIRLVMLVNDVSLRNLVPGEAAKGFGFFQVETVVRLLVGRGHARRTRPDVGWRQGEAAPTRHSERQAIRQAGRWRRHAFDFPALPAPAARTRPVGAAIVGSGTVSNTAADGEPGRPIDEGGVGYACIAEMRAVEASRGQAEDLIPQIRLRGPDRDEGRRRPLNLRRHRAEPRALRAMNLRRAVSCV